jgi:hypothetical protein
VVTTTTDHAGMLALGPAPTLQLLLQVVALRDALALGAPAFMEGRFADLPALSAEPDVGWADLLSDRP